MSDEVNIDGGIRLDQRTKISLMAALIYGTMENPDIAKAVDAAYTLDQKVGDKLRFIKNQRKRAINQQPLTPERR